MTYGEKLKDPRWQKKRLEIMQRDDFMCQYCNDKTTQLDVHHYEYCGNPWDAESQNLVTLCRHCHLAAENIKPLKILCSEKLTMNHVVDVYYLVKTPKKTGLFISEIIDDRISITMAGYFDEVESLIKKLSERLIL